MCRLTFNALKLRTLVTSRDRIVQGRSLSYGGRSHEISRLLEDSGLKEVLKGFFSRFMLDSFPLIALRLRKRLH